jgi:hypothetical protein
MIVISECVLDEILHGAATDHYTANRYNELLGRPDKLTIHAIVDNADANGTLEVQIEHSADQRNWKSKNGTPEIDDPASSILTSSAVSSVGSDSGSNASLPFVRLRVRMTTTARAHVKIYVCGRDA